MSIQKVDFPTLHTPAVLLDLNVLESNITEMSHLAAEAGVKLRPHVKIHESAAIAKMQLDTGAVGIEVGSIDQVETMADAGIEDILIAHPVWGAHKLESLKRLLSRKNLKLTFVIDMFEHGQAISQIAESQKRTVPVVIKLETGGNRLGVMPGQAALDLTKELLKLPSIEFKGIYAHEVYSGPTTEGAKSEAFRVASLTVETAKLLEEHGIAVDHVSVGSSPTFKHTCCYLKQGEFREITEIHPGKLAIDDIVQEMMEDSEKGSPSLSVLTTVISTSHSGHAVIDAGFKTFGFDALVNYHDRPDYLWEGKPRFGLVKGRPDLWFGALHAEVGRIFYRDRRRKLKLGQRLEVIPNNATLVIHLQDKIYGLRHGKVEMIIPINRGCPDPFQTP
jgi:D-serine deaminase-like pyridoxal phosphate-dependent protein